MKKCKICCKTKSLDDFYYHPSTKDRRNIYCKVCESNNSKQWRLKNRDKKNENESRYRKTNKGRELKSIERIKWRAKNPEKYKALGILNSAVKYKKIVKGLCEVCGLDKVHAHHEDYNKPLDVIWLCPLHHRELHLKKGNK